MAQTGFLSSCCQGAAGKRWKKPNCPLVGEWINKLWGIPTLDYYSAIKRNEILKHATTRMNLEDIMLSEIRKIGKGQYYITPFT